MTVRVDIVTTTIGTGEFVAAYLDAIEAGPAPEDTRLVVIPDRRTSAGLYHACSEAQKRLPNAVLCPSLGEQVDFLGSIGAPRFIPWNSDNRRNIGYLLALASGADVVVSVDDDNLPADATFLREHAVVTEPRGQYDILTSESGWFNSCSLLRIEGEPVFPRGLPIAARTDAASDIVSGSARVRMNAGLWLGDPDVDAATRLAVRPRAVTFRGDSVVLASDTWCPINSQNTAVAACILPAYYYPRMGSVVEGARIDRYGDILSGYFAQACVKHMGDSVRFGTPIVRHLRNEHDLLDDLRRELPGMSIIERLAPALRDAELDGATYSDAYASLADWLDLFATMEFAAHDDARRFLREVAEAMRMWLRLTATVTGYALA